MSFHSLQFSAYGAKQTILSGTAPEEPSFALLDLVYGGAEGGSLTDAEYLDLLVTDMSAWTPLIRSTPYASLGGFTLQHGTYGKFMTAEEAFSFALVDERPCQGIIHFYTGVDSENPVNVAAGAYRDENDGGEFPGTELVKLNSTHLDATESPTVSVGPSLTTTVDGCILVMSGLDWGDNTTDFAPPSGMTERFDDVLMTLDTEVLGGAGATGARSRSNNNSGSTNGWTAHMVALAPAEEGGGGLSIPVAMHHYRSRRV